MRADLVDLKVGDTITRLLSGVIPMDLVVTSLTDDVITCGEYEYSFCRKSGGEIDEYLGWVPPFVNGTGSVLKRRA